MRTSWTKVLALLVAGQSTTAFTPAGIPSILLPNRIIDHDSISALSNPNIKAYNLSVPIDHFHNDTRYEPHSFGYYNLRYWLDISNYREGGPVIVLHSGEFDSVSRLPYLEHGIVPKLTKALGGVGLVMEHRYYGTSFPTEDVTTENLRFLSTEQALADTAYFAKNISFPGLEHVNLTAERAPWIIYGGSYAGSLAALTRKIYPDIYWGGISSSGVPQVIDEYWQYMEAARHFAPKDCSEATQHLVHIVDTILASGNKDEVDRLKELFHLQGLKDDDFAMTISAGIMGLQGTNWDIQEDSPILAFYCGSVTSDAVLYASMRHRIPAVRHFVNLGGYEKHVDKLSMQLLNWAGFIRNIVKENAKTLCKGRSLEECYSLRHSGLDTRAGVNWERSWYYQTCTEWGFFMTGAGVPKDTLPLLPRAITYEYATWHCSNLFNITTRPNIDAINKYGGFNFSHHRLAFIDGKQDPWRAASPHAMGQPDRKSTISEPFALVDWGVHHWDEFGVAEGEEEEGLPPKQVVDIQNQMVHFVGEWLKEWKEEQKQKKTSSQQEADGYESNIEL